MDYFMFWFYAGLAKLAWALLFIVTIYGVVGFCTLPGWIKKKRCKHSSFRETRACEGICNHCNKNLGFVGELDRSKQSN